MTAWTSCDLSPATTHSASEASPGAPVARPADVTRAPQQRPARTKVSTSPLRPRGSPSFRSSACGARPGPPPTPSPKASPSLPYALKVISPFKGTSGRCSNRAPSQGHSLVRLSLAPVPRDAPTQLSAAPPRMTQHGATSPLQPTLQAPAICRK